MRAKSRSEFRTNPADEEITVKFGFRNMQPPRNILGPVVRRLREEAGLTQPMLVARIHRKGWDISRETLAKVEAQIRWIADFEVLHLAAALGVTPGDLFKQAATTHKKSGIPGSLHGGGK